MQRETLEDLTNADIEEMMNLRNFGAWCRHDLDRLGYGKPATVIIKGGPSPDISDDDAMLVDRALGMVEACHKRDFKILCRAYIWGMDDHEIADAMKLSSNRVTVLRGGALKSWFYSWRGLTQDYRSSGNEQ